jgi:hypothetical protein
MPGGNDSEYNALYQLACESGLMAVAAGGVGRTTGFVNEDDLVYAIACNMRATIGGLSGTPCDIGWSDTDSAWLAILFYSNQLTGLTGASLDAGNTGSIEGKIYGTLCNMRQVSANTGTQSEARSGSYLQTLDALGCVVAQIVTNGFGPVVASFVLLNDGSGHVLTNSGGNVLLNT